MNLSERFKRMLERWRAAARDIVAASIAAALAWMIAQKLNGHHQPLFASIAALVCLAPGLPSHSKQAVGMMLGVSTGIIIGEVSLHFFNFELPYRVGLVTFLAMMIGAAYGGGPVIPIQAAVSALLVILQGFSVAGPTRLLDVLVGASIGLFFSQILLTPDPVRIIDRAAQQLLGRLAEGYTQCAKALSEADHHLAQNALLQISKAHESVVALETGIATARSSARWSLRGRLAAQQVTDLAERYDRWAIRLYASSLLFSEALAHELRKNESPPVWLQKRIERAALECRILLGEQAEPLHAISELADTPEEAWQLCLAHLTETEATLSSFKQANQAALS